MTWSKGQSFVLLNNGMIVSQVKTHIQEKQNFFKNEQMVKLKESKQRFHRRFEYLQVLGFLLLCSFGADLAATGGSGAQLRGDEEGETLHHPPSAQKVGPVA